MIASSLVICPFPRSYVISSEDHFWAAKTEPDSRAYFVHGDPLQRLRPCQARYWLGSTGLCRHAYGCAESGDDIFWISRNTMLVQIQSVELAFGGDTQRSG